MPQYLIATCPGLDYADPGHFLRLFQDKDATNFFSQRYYTVFEEVMGVYVYLDLVVLLNFIVDLLLLLGAERLAGHSQNIKKAMLAAGTGALYAGVCMLPELRFLGSTLWRLVCLSLMSAIAFGLNRSAFRRGAIFVILSTSLGGIALGMNGSFWSIVMAATGVLVMCLLGFRRGVAARYSMVELVHKGTRIQLTALVDTGNLLRDPVSGEKVLIASVPVAQRLFGLNNEQVSDPVKTLEEGSITGLRLIPFHSVANGSGLLLAARLDKVSINTVPTGTLVAFAPHPFGVGREYQALTGGEG